MLLGLMLPTLGTVAMAGSDTHRAWIETSLEPDRLIAVAYVEAAHDASLDYELISAKSGSAGRSNTSQSGSLRLQQGESRSINRLRLGIHGDDQYTLTLRIYENDRLVAEDSVTYP
jgi:hypothetical protein